MEKLYRRRVWAGFSDGRIHFRTIDTGFGGWGEGATLNVPAIFGSRAAARREYQDVRPVEVRELKRATKRRMT